MGGLWRRRRYGPHCGSAQVLQIVSNCSPPHNVATGVEPDKRSAAVLSLYLCFRLPRPAHDQPVRRACPPSSFATRAGASSSTCSWRASSVRRVSFACLACTAARAELKNFLGREVHLFIEVRVRENWLEERERYDNMGLDFDGRKGR